MNDFFTSGEKLTAFKLNELFSRLSRRVESLESAQNQTSGSLGYNTGAVTGLGGRPRGLDTPLGAYPPRRHAINPQSFYTHVKTTLWQFPTVGEPDQGAGHSVTSGTEGYDTEASGVAGEEEAQSITCEYHLTDFYPVEWTPHGAAEAKSATAFFGVEWEAGEGRHFIHLQKGEAYEFSNTYDPETGSITWSQRLGQPRALPWGSRPGEHGAWHFFQQDFNIIQPTAISSYSKTDGEFASIHYSETGKSSTVHPTQDASYALYSKIFLNGAKFKRLRQGEGVKLSEHEGIIEVASMPWRVWYEAISNSDTDSETSNTEDFNGFAWYGMHSPAHSSHGKSPEGLRVHAGSGTVWWHIYSHQNHLDSRTSATSSFGLSIFVREGLHHSAQVAFQAEGGIVLPSTTGAITSWTTAYAISNTSDFGDYGVAAHGDTGRGAFFAHGGSGTVAWHITNSHSSPTGQFGFHVAIERATDIDPDGARVRLTPWGGITLPGGTSGMSSITTYIETLSTTNQTTEPQAFKGHIIVPSNSSYEITGSIASWHFSGVGRFGLALTAVYNSGNSGLSLQYQPYIIS